MRPSPPGWPSRSGWSGTLRTAAGCSTPGRGRAKCLAPGRAHGTRAAARRPAAGRRGSHLAGPLPAGTAAARRCPGRAAAAAPGPNRTTGSPWYWTLSVPHFTLTVASMSTLTCTESRRSTRPDSTRGSRLVSGPLAMVFLAEFSSLTSFYLLLSVTPAYAAAAGAGSADAGLVTGVLLLGTVAAELAAPVLMRRLKFRTLLAAGALLLGVPALALLASGSLALMVTVSVVRGFGFGLSTVTSGALTAMLVPPQRRGEGLGLFGVVATAPGIVALPAGVWLAGRSGIAVVVVMAAATALVPVAAFPWLPGRTSPGAVRPGSASGLLSGLRQGSQRRPFLIFAASTMAGGVVVSFLPLAAGVSGTVVAAGLLA